MKNGNLPLIGLIALCAASLALGLVYIAALPLFLSAASDAKRQNHVSPAVEARPGEIIALKVAYPYSRAHPLHELVTNEFGAKLVATANSPFIPETYPAGVLGNTEETLKGLSKGTIELCIVDDELFAAIPDLQRAWEAERSRATRHGGITLESALARLLRDEDIIALAWFDGGRRHLWTVKEAVAKGSRKALLSTRNSSARALIGKFRLNATVESIKPDQSTVRRRGIGYVELSPTEWYYQGWSALADGKIAADLYDVPFFILMSARTYYSMDKARRDLVRSAAEELAAVAAAVMKDADEEILYDLETENLR